MPAPLGVGLGAKTPFSLWGFHVTDTGRSEAVRGWEPHGEHVTAASSRDSRLCAWRVHLGLPRWSRHALPWFLFRDR